MKEEQVVDYGRNHLNKYSNTNMKDFKYTYSYHMSFSKTGSNYVFTSYYHEYNFTGSLNHSLGIVII